MGPSVIPPSSGSESEAPSTRLSIHKHLTLSRCPLPREAPGSEALVTEAPRTSQVPKNEDPRLLILCLESTLETTPASPRRRVLHKRQTQPGRLQKVDGGGKNDLRHDETIRKLSRSCTKRNDVLKNKRPNYETPKRPMALRRKKKKKKKELASFLILISNMTSQPPRSNVSFSYNRPPHFNADYRSRASDSRLARSLYDISSCGGEVPSCLDILQDEYLVGHGGSSILKSSD